MGDLQLAEEEWNTQGRQIVARPPKRRHGEGRGRGGHLVNRFPLGVLVQTNAKGVGSVSLPKAGFFPSGFLRQERGEGQRFFGVFCFLIT